ncbi:MAG: DUF1997 domain-containing protein [Elainellaceae cyanobacterium]
MPRFATSQSVEIELPGSLPQLAAYLDQPSRIVYALFDARRVQKLEDDIFRLQMQTLQFFMLKVQPTVDLRVWTDSQHVLHIEAIDCQLTGIDAINHQFALTLTGHLRPAAGSPDGADPLTTPSSVAAQLEGVADLAIKVELPATFALISNGLIKRAGNKLLGGVLGTIKQRLVNCLSDDYVQWAASQVNQVTVP